MLAEPMAVAAAGRAAGCGVGAAAGGARHPPLQPQRHAGQPRGHSPRPTAVFVGEQEKEPQHLNLKTLDFQHYKKHNTPIILKSCKFGFAIILKSCKFAPVIIAKS